MAYLQVNFFSEVLGLACSMDVILPEDTKGLIGMDGKQISGDSKVLYLLHGLSDDHTIWQRRTSIERYVAPLGLAVVMPAVHRSFYTNMEYGYNYWTFISEELPQKVKTMFHISHKREDTFAAGLSMGGYGAFKLGMACPEKFGAVASLSGAVDMKERFINDPNNGLSREMEMIYGLDVKNMKDENDIVYMMEKNVKEKKELPKLYMCCGTDDFLYEMNVGFKKKADKLGVDIKFVENKGTHEWGYWDTMIQAVLNWLPLL